MQHRYHIIKPSIFSLLTLLTLLPSCQTPAPVAPGINPPPAQGFFGRRRQQPLLPERANMAVIFVGGFSEQVLLHFREAYETMPVLPGKGKQLRAYYAWDSGTGNLLFHSTWKLQRDLNAFFRVNPTAQAVLIGHSYGGSAIMDALRHVKGPHGRITVLTIDPVSRRKSSKPRERATNVSLWLNAYCYPYRGFRDIFARMGGPWRHCPQADLNLNYPGTKRDKEGNRYAHVYPKPILMFPHPDTKKSLYEILCEHLKKNS